jgi:hypothetical protein
VACGVSDAMVVKVSFVWHVLLLRHNLEEKLVFINSVETALSVAQSFAK